MRSLSIAIVKWDVDDVTLLIQAKCGKLSLFADDDVIHLLMPKEPSRVLVALAKALVTLCNGWMDGVLWRNNAQEGLYKCQLR